MNNSDAVLERSVIAISGPETSDFLQGLVTNDVTKLASHGILYAALLTPQGKILFDFFLHASDSALLLDCASASADALLRKLLLYRLRARVDVTLRKDLAVVTSWESTQGDPTARPDPRVPAMGWRSIIAADRLNSTAGARSYTSRRLELGVPEAADFGQDSIFALDAGLEELHGVSFEKGCYVGQELTARMKHRGTARKRLLPLTTQASALPDPPTPITVEGKDVGSITSTYGNRGFALVRLDRLAEAQGLQLEAAAIPVFVSRPSWLGA